MDDLADFRVVPASRANFDDLQAAFGARGMGSRCQCQRYKLQPGESFANVPVEELAHRLRQQTGDDADTPATTQSTDTSDSAETSGLVGYLGEDLVGWCAVEPRTAYAGLLRVAKVPWEGRNEDRGDGSIWAITCLFVRAGHRRRGISRALALAAVDHARGRGASALEAYPVTTTAGVIAVERHVGTVATFAEAGLRQVRQPTPRRVVMRIDY